MRKPHVLRVAMMRVFQAIAENASAQAINSVLAARSFGCDESPELEN